MGTTEPENKTTVKNNWKESRRRRGKQDGSWKNMEATAPDRVGRKQVVCGPRSTGCISKLSGHYDGSEN